MRNWVRRIVQIAKGTETKRTESIACNMCYELKNCNSLRYASVLGTSSIKKITPQRKNS